MSTYKLTYFNVMGRAEPARFIFAQAGQEYEDNRVSAEEFGKMKPDLWPGSLPVLYVDGKSLSGSRTITRYLGEKFGLAGCNDFENADLDSIADVIEDLNQKVVPAIWGTEESQVKGKEVLLKEAIPKYFGILEKRVNSNGVAEGWILGNKLTYIDFHVSIMLDGLLRLDPTLNDNYPALKKLSDAVKAQPRIAEWIKKRPDTPF